ncbi:MAG: short-chain dehydrogenase [Chloroflexi bacterium]|nr:short-chain dehydrogenase [Chloroflexota bacterium]
MLKIMIIGATSVIAQETARFFATEGAEFFLVGIPADKLGVIKDDLVARGAKRAEVYEADLTDFDKHPQIIESAVQAMGSIDAVLIAHGTLGNQKAAEASVEVALKEINLNLLSNISLLTLLGNYFEKQRRGCIAVISSVAGDRGRGSNYVYGTAKAGTTTFMQGLRSRLAKSGVAVVTIKPGLVDTPMTADIKKNFLFSDPATVGKAIYLGMKKGKDTVYAPWFWRYIMAIIIHIPEFIFKKMSL